MANWKWNDATRQTATLNLGNGVLRSAGLDADDLKSFLAGGGVPDAEDAPHIVTNDELYDNQLLQNAVFKAFVLAFLAGTVTVGMTPAAAKAAIKAKM